MGAALFVRSVRDACGDDPRNPINASVAFLLSSATADGAETVMSWRRERDFELAELTTCLRLSYRAKFRSEKADKTSCTRFLVTIDGVFCIGGTGTKIDSNSTGYSRINVRNLCVAFDRFGSPSARAEPCRQPNDDVFVDFGYVVQTVGWIISNCWKTGCKAQKHYVDP